MEEALLAAVAIAASPFAVVPAVLLLFAARPRPCSAGFAAGWAAGVGAVTLLAVLLADLVTLPDTPPAWLSWSRVALGALLVGYGLVTLLRRGDGDGEVPGWMRSLEEATPGSATRFGLVASAANPKVALLALAGGFSLGADTSGAAGELGLVVLFAAVASLTAVAPVLAHLAWGDRVLTRLARVKDWLVAHTTPLLGGVLLVIGGLVLWKGVSAL